MCARPAPHTLPPPPPRSPARAQSLKPPKLDRIPVRAIADCGQVQTSSGSRFVRAGETHFMSRADCEPLVRQGRLTQLPWD